MKRFILNVTHSDKYNRIFKVDIEAIGKDAEEVKHRLKACQCKIHTCKEIPIGKVLISPGYEKRIIKDYVPKNERTRIEA